MMAHPGTNCVLNCVLSFHVFILSPTISHNRQVVSSIIWAAGVVVVKQHPVGTMLNKGQIARVTLVVAGEESVVLVSHYASLSPFCADISFVAIKNSPGILL